MKTNTMRLLTTILCLLFCVTAFAQKKTTDVSKIVGNWTYSAPNAPYGYQDGKLELKQEKGKLVAKVNIQGNVMTITNIKITKDKYEASFYLDGSDINLTLIQNEDKIKGEAYADGMEIPVTFKRVKK